MDGVEGRAGGRERHAAPGAAVPDALARICAQTRAEVSRRAAAVPLREVERRARAALAPPRGFAAALARSTARGEPALIAEIKRASPSGGRIRPDGDPAGIARQYEQAGAACLSVLTDGPSFGGSNADLAAARAATGLPVLRKDFILEPWQVYETRAMGADCLLLIMAALADDAAAGLMALAGSLGLDVLVEAHDAPELARALRLGPALVGINNRDLRTLRTDLAATERLAPLVPAGPLVVAESGIRTRADVLRLAQAGAGAVLVGESLLRAADPGLACAALLGRA